MNSPYRFEFKYLLTPHVAEQLREEFKFFGLELDSYSPSPDGYWVTSLYFDSYDLKDYYDKSGGFLRRKKIRARIYEPFLDNSPSVLLELKEKHDAQILKSRLVLSRDEWQTFISRGVSALVAMERKDMDKEAKDEIAWNLISFSARPQMIVRYKRKAFMASYGNVRITFDTNLEACKKTNLDYNAFMVPVLKDSIVLEIKAKSNAVLPKWLNALIRKHDLKRDAVSKYAYAVEAIHEYNPLPR